MNGPKSSALPRYLLMAAVAAALLAVSWWFLTERAGATAAVAAPAD